MRKEQSSNTFQNGMVLDLGNFDLPNTAYSRALNASLISGNGNEGTLQNDLGNITSSSLKLTPGFLPIGITTHNGIAYIASYNPKTEEGEIGTFPSPVSSDITDSTLTLSLPYYLRQDGNYNGALNDRNATSVITLANEVRAGDFFSLELENSELSSDYYLPNKQATTSYSLVNITDLNNRIVIPLTNYSNYIVPANGSLVLQLQPLKCKLISSSTTVSDDLENIIITVIYKSEVEVSDISQNSEPLGSVLEGNDKSRITVERINVNDNYVFTITIPRKNIKGESVYTITPKVPVGYLPEESAKIQLSKSIVSNSVELSTYKYKYDDGNKLNSVVLGFNTGLYTKITRVIVGDDVITPEYGLYKTQLSKTDELKYITIKVYVKGQDDPIVFNRWMYFNELMNRYYDDVLNFSLVSPVLDYQVSLNLALDESILEISKKYKELKDKNHMFDQYVFSPDTLDESINQQDRELHFDDKVQRTVKYTFTKKSIMEDAINLDSILEASCSLLNTYKYRYSANYGETFLPNQALNAEKYNLIKIWDEAHDPNASDEDKARLSLKYPGISGSTVIRSANGTIANNALTFNFTIPIDTNYRRTISKKRVTPTYYQRALLNSSNYDSWGFQYEIQDGKIKKFFIASQYSVEGNKLRVGSRLLDLPGFWDNEKFGRDLYKALQENNLSKNLVVVKINNKACIYYKLQDSYVPIDGFEYTSDTLYESGLFFSSKFCLTLFSSLYFDTYNNKNSDKPTSNAKISSSMICTTGMDGEIQIDVHSKPLSTDNSNLLKLVNTKKGGVTSIQELHDSPNLDVTINLNIDNASFTDKRPILSEADKFKLPLYSNEVRNLTATVNDELTTMIEIPGGKKIFSKERYLFNYLYLNNELVPLYTFNDNPNTHLQDLLEFKIIADSKISLKFEGTSGNSINMNPILNMFNLRYYDKQSINSPFSGIRQ